MEATVRAIVLRRRDSGESDRRLTLLTEELGKIDAVAKGARKAASRLAGSSDPLIVAVMTLAEGKVNRFVTQSQPVTSFRGLRTDYDRLNFALALAELCAAVLPFEQPMPDAYVLMLRALALIEAHPKPLVALVWAEVQLLGIAGFLPQFDVCVQVGKPVVEPDPQVSPQAGGYISPEVAGQFPDRFGTTREALIGLARLVDLETPPGNLRFAEQCLWTLLPFWRDVAGIPLPANESVVAEVRHG